MDPDSILWRATFFFSTFFFFSPFLPRLQSWHGLNPWQSPLPSYTSFFPLLFSCFFLSSNFFLPLSPACLPSFFFPFSYSFSYSFSSSSFFFFLFFSSSPFSRFSFLSFLPLFYSPGFFLLCPSYLFLVFFCVFFPSPPLNRFFPPSFLFIYLFAKGAAIT